jgi:hypothetical protein
MERFVRGLIKCVVCSALLLSEQNGAWAGNNRTAHYGQDGTFHRKTYKASVRRSEIRASVILAQRLRSALGRNRDGQYIVPIVHYDGDRTVHINHRDGWRFEDLDPDAQGWAREQVERMVRLGWKLTPGVGVDQSVANFRFEEDGTVRAWFDQTLHL